MTEKTALCLLAEDAEEMEAVITVDILRRAKIAVTIASITEKECIKCSRGVKICTDTKIDDIKDQKFDAVILPGGAGWKNLAASSRVGDILKTYESENRIIAAICAAPNVLRIHGIAKGKKITAHPSSSNLKEYYNYIESEGVIIDGNIITGKGPAFTYDFGLAIIEKLVGEDAAHTIASDLLYKNYKSLF